MEKTSLEKSHSTWSNTKLTGLCIATIICFSLAWIMLALSTKHIVVLTPTFDMFIVFALFVATIVCLIGFNKFKR